MSFAPRYFTLGQKLVAFIAPLHTGAAVVLMVVVPGAIETAERRHSLERTRPSTRAKLPLSPETPADLRIEPRRSESSRR